MKRFASYISPLLFLFLINCKQKPQQVVFPFSQWTIGANGHPITWRYAEGLDYNNSFIKGPDGEAWEDWYQKILEYRQAVRSKIGRETPYLRIHFPLHQEETKLHFDRFSYQLDLQPGEEIMITGRSKTSGIPFTIYFGFDMKSKGEEKSYVQRQQLKSVDSLWIASSEEWTEFRKVIKVPQFGADRLSAVPVLRISEAAGEKNEGEVFITDLQLHTSYTKRREELLSRIENYISRQSQYIDLSIPNELSWTHQNFVMGFVYIWDQKFWDPVEGKYLVDEYCQVMEKEFGGLQSVILWHSYPNIGVDERNQFDFFEAMPGGMHGLKKVVEDFHRNGVKVFLTYNPWDLDTRRPEKHDFTLLAQILSDSGADGLFLDTWKSAKGSISIFDVEQSIRDEVNKLGKTVAFTTEILPEFKDLTGEDALTSSWGQEIDPFHFTDLSHQKWIMPQHKQYYIKRMLKDRKPILAHAWINGQGIQLWENIFGIMNIWEPEHRLWLRKMNRIWKDYGQFYLSDDWKPFYPTGHPKVISSIWEKGGEKLVHLVDTASSFTEVKWEVSSEPRFRYFDLWNGKELQPFEEYGKRWVSIPVQHFGALLQTPSHSGDLVNLLGRQQMDSFSKLPKNDGYNEERSLQNPVLYHYQASSKPTLKTDLKKIIGGEFTFLCKHIWREGLCYPNEGAAHNQDLVISREAGVQRIVHSHRMKIPELEIMPRVVTNGQFEEFLLATGYRPTYPQNFLKHWDGNNCPPDIKDAPVVYVSLEDARAFAEWAGMELPNEWEWQRAAEVLGDGFVFNEVFEWNESERFDGYNRFVTLRGGSSRWKTPSSWWYFPGAPFGEVTGGPQPYDSHVKYFLMYPGMDRASTIGFRCVKR